MAVSAPAIFLDKDGTLIDDVPYNVDPALIRLRPGAGAALRALQAAGFRLLVVSNQSGIARGMFAEEALVAVETRLRVLLAAEQVWLDGFLYCPHHPDGVVPAYARACACRKPAPGMLLHAARTLDLDLGHSWLFGDILDDIEAGHRAGCRAVLVDSGGETLWQITPARAPDAIVSNLVAAAHLALASRPHLTPLPIPAREGERPRLHSAEEATGRGGASGRRLVRCTGQPNPGSPSANLALPQGGRGSEPAPQPQEACSFPIQPPMPRPRSSPRVGERSGEGYHAPPKHPNPLPQGGRDGLCEAEPGLDSRGATPAASSENRSTPKLPFPRRDRAGG